MDLQKLKPKKLSSLAGADDKTKKTVKGVLIGVLVVLLGAFGLEASSNDWDLGKILSGESWSDAKVERDAAGDILRDLEGNIVTSGGKKTNEYNCEDFSNQEGAQKFFTAAGGVSGDTNRLDGDKDGLACEHLP